MKAVIHDCPLCNIPHAGDCPKEDELQRRAEAIRLTWTPERLARQENYRPVEFNPQPQIMLAPGKKRGRE